jgi:hypothetical protein
MSGWKEGVFSFGLTDFVNPGNGYVKNAKILQFHDKTIENPTTEKVGVKFWQIPGKQFWYVFDVMVAYDPSQRTQSSQIDMRYYDATSEHLQLSGTLSGTASSPIPSNTWANITNTPFIGTALDGLKTTGNVLSSFNSVSNYSAVVKDWARAKAVSSELGFEPTEVDIDVVKNFSDIIGGVPASLLNKQSIKFIDLMNVSGFVSSTSGLLGSYGGFIAGAMKGVSSLFGGGSGSSPLTLRLDGTLTLSGDLTGSAPHAISSIGLAGTQRSVALPNLSYFEKVHPGEVIGGYSISRRPKIVAFVSGQTTFSQILAGWHASANDVGIQYLNYEVSPKLNAYLLVESPRGWVASNPSISLSNKVESYEVADKRVSSATVSLFPKGKYMAEPKVADISKASAIWNVDKVSQYSGDAKLWRVDMSHNLDGIKAHLSNVAIKYNRTIDWIGSDGVKRHENFTNTVSGDVTVVYLGESNNLSVDEMRKQARITLGYPEKEVNLAPILNLLLD